MMVGVIIPSRATVWRMMPGVTIETLGAPTTWFSNHDDASALEQANAGYMRTGGCPFSPTSVEFRLEEAPPDGAAYQLVYEGDPPMKELARTKIGDETVVIFECEWVAIIQPGGDFVVARCN